MRVEAAAFTGEFDFGKRAERPTSPPFSPQLSFLSEISVDF
jgi:hypothetical protein